MEEKTMEKDTKKKRSLPFVIGVPAVLIVALAFLALGGFIRGRRVEVISGYISLNQRDIAIEVAEKAELEVVETSEITGKQVTWISSDTTVATVDDQGNVTGVAGGETRITVVVKDETKEYTASCIVTVKAEGLEYSTYQIQWHTQRKDRNGYEVSVETYERLVGSQVNLTKYDARAKLPAYYVLNTDKCVLSGTVKEDKAGCVLKVYFDVAEISYAVDYYFESATALGTYELKETKKYEAYAFSEIAASLKVAKGFVVNEKAKGSVLKVDSITPESRLKVYSDRIRSKVTIKYVLDRANGKTATYENVYGVGLVGAPADALKENLAPYKADPYIGGVAVTNIQSTVKNLTQDTQIVFKLTGKGFLYQTDGSILEDYYEVAKSAYTYLQGSGKTIYLSAKYDLTGSTTNLYGITLKSGSENRQIFFNHQGVVVLKNYEWQPGTVSEWAFEFNHTEETGYIIAQNIAAMYETRIQSAVSEMIGITQPSSHDIIWAVWNGTLYCSVNGDVVMRLPLNKLVATWDANTKFEIGFTAYDGVSMGDEFSVRNVDVRYDNNAKSKLHTDVKVAGVGVIQGLAYDPISGGYLPTSTHGGTWIYGKETKKNNGFTVDATWMDKDNTGTLLGATVQMGNRSIQYYVRGQNRLYQTQQNHTWEGAMGIDLTRINNGKMFDENGHSKIGAYVKDGYFYVTFNGVQAVCVNMVALFSDYTRDSEVSVGVCTMNTSSGLAYFKNIEVLDEKAVADQQGLARWGYYSEILFGGTGKYNFAEGTLEKEMEGWHGAFLKGGSEKWHIKGVMKRNDARDSGDLLMGVEIATNNNLMTFLGHNNGFVRVQGADWDFQYNKGSDSYAFGNSHGQFFTAVRNRDELPFEMVIYQDILYVYLDGELSWRIPLTEPQFGFEKDSHYAVRLNMADPNRKGMFKDLEVYMGYQVDEETDFMTYKGTKYSLKKAIAKTEANLEKYKDIKDIYQRGNLLEEIIFTEANRVLYPTFDNDKNQGMKVTLAHKDGKIGGLYNGIILKSGNDTAKIMVDSSLNMIILQQGEKSSTAKILSACTSAYVNGKCELAVLAKDGKLFVTANDTPLGAIKLDEILENYKKDDKVTFGIYLKNTEAGVVGFGDITGLTGKETDIEYRDSNMQLTATKFMVANVANGMKADSLNGKVTVNLTNGAVNHLWFATDNAAYSSKKWEITGSFKQLVALMKGFTIQSADGAKTGFYTIYTDGVSLNQNWGYPVGGGWNVYNVDGVYMLNNRYYGYMGRNNISFKCKMVIENDIFSFYVQDQLAWQLPLTDAWFGGFASGTSYRFALRCLDANGQAEWSDLTVKYGKE